jgi:hypothetical protein
MPRCCRFFVFPRREESAYRQRSVIDEQRGERRKSGANPEGGVAGYLNRLLRRRPGFAARGLSLGGGDLPAHAKWMCKENKIDRAHKISNTARRTR